LPIDIEVGRAIVPAGALSGAPKRRLKGGRSQDWLPHISPRVALSHRRQYRPPVRSQYRPVIIALLPVMSGKLANQSMELSKRIL
jgi:hypothetical protein